MKNKLESLQILFDEIYCNDIKNINKALVALRDKGATQMESVKVLIKNLKIGLKEADNIVRNSDAWLDRKEDTTHVRNIFWDALKNLKK